MLCQAFSLQLYHQVYDERAKKASLQLVGIVTYYGKHYSTFFFHSKLRTWIYFDDARVKEVRVLRILITLKRNEVVTNNYP